MIIKQCNKPAIKVWKVYIFEVNFNCFDKNISHCKSFKNVFVYNS